MIAFHDHLLDIEHDAAIVCSTGLTTPHEAAHRTRKFSGFFAPKIRACLPVSVGSAANTRGVRPEYARGLRAVVSSRRLFIRMAPITENEGGHHGL